MVIKTKSSRKFRLLKISLGIAIIAALCIGGFFVYRQNHTNNTSTTLNDPSKVNLDPATPQEIADSNQHKEDIVNEDNKNPAEQPSTQASVTPLIIDASQQAQNIEIRSFMPGIYEVGGTCAVVFTNGSSSVTKTNAAVQDATTTRCPNLSIPRSEFDKSGTWTVTVSYKSAAYKGTSAASTLQIQ